MAPFFPCHVRKNHFSTLVMKGYFINQLFIISMRIKLQEFFKNESRRGCPLFMRMNNSSLWISRFRSISSHDNDYKKYSQDSLIFCCVMALLSGY